MSGIVYKAAPVFRRSFKVPNADALRWFPGHMDKGKAKTTTKINTILFFLIGLLEINTEIRFFCSNYFFALRPYIYSWAILEQ
jgi:hypothetical protein